MSSYKKIFIILFIFFVLWYRLGGKRLFRKDRTYEKISSNLFQVIKPKPDNFISAYSQLPETAKYQRFIGKKYHPLGFEQFELDPELKQKLVSFWEKGGASKERMPGVIHGTETSNKNESILNIKSLKRGDYKLYKELNDYIEQKLIKWIGISDKMIHRSTYGPREYRTGAYLIPHVDRGETHVLSAIVNISQKGVLKDWPLVVYDHNDNRHEIIMGPGKDLVLYESATVIHGRPVPLVGESYINIFIHFETPEWKNEVVNKIKQKYPNWGSKS